VIQGSLLLFLDTLNFSAKIDLCFGFCFCFFCFLQFCHEIRKTAFFSTSMRDQKQKQKQKQKTKRNKTKQNNSKKTWKGKSLD